MSNAVNIPAPVPIDGGWRVKTLPNGKTVDVLRMMFNYRVVLSRPDGVNIDHGWCYFGHGRTEDGKERTMETAKVAAILAASDWDGTGSPAGFDKQAH